MIPIPPSRSVLSEAIALPCSDGHKEKNARYLRWEIKWRKFFCLKNHLRSVFIEAKNSLLDRQLQEKNLTAEPSGLSFDSSPFI